MRPFLHQTFVAVFDLKTKIMGLIALKFGTNMQLINLKLLSKFHVARPNRSRVINKSLKFDTC